MTSRKTTDNGSFSYKPGISGLYEASGENRVEIVAGNVMTGLMFDNEQVGASLLAMPSPRWTSVIQSMPSRAGAGDSEFVADRQHIVLEFGVFLESDGFVGFLRDFVVAAGGNTHAHGIGFLGHFFCGADQVVGHQLAAGVLGDINIVEDPHTFERKRGETRVKLAETHQFVAVVIGQRQVDHRLLATQAFFEERPGRVRIRQGTIKLAIFDEQRGQLVQVFEGRLNNPHGRSRLQVAVLRL